jgi:hypothetical protein
VTAGVLPLGVGTHQPGVLLGGSVCYIFEMNKKIPVRADTKLRIPFYELHELQGDLKEFPEDLDREKCKQEILKDGFTFPMAVWKDNSSDQIKWYIVDGHGRKEIVKELVEQDGYEIDPLPCVEIFAETIDDAKKLILASSSIYHRTTEQGLYNFMSDTNISVDEFLDRYSIPELDTAEFQRNYFPDPIEPGAGEPVTVNFDAYLDKSIKPVTLYFSAEDYQKIIPAMDMLMKATETKDYSSLVWRLVFEKSST